jgi:hypothetical protein
MGSLIFKQSALKLGQRFFEFTSVLTPANVLHSSFFILHFYSRSQNVHFIPPSRPHCVATLRY